MSNSSYPILEEKFIDQLDRIIEEHMTSEQFCVDDLSGLLYLSNSQVYRKIRQQTGVSPSNYILQKRLEKAVDLIENTKTPITQIAYELGFNTASYFSTCFSDFFGYPPSDLRRK